MRDLFITMIVLGTLPFILMRPYIGIYAWSWIGYMSPHRLSYGFAFSFPFAQLIALVLLVGFVFNKDSKRFPITPLTIVWILFLLWMCFTTIFALYPDDAQNQLIKVLKAQFIAFLTVMLINSRERLHILAWVIFLSIGFFGIKGGVFTIMTGGGHRVNGPPGTYIGGNNELALAILMVTPLAIYLRHVTKNTWIKLFLLVAMLLMVVSAIGSQSRGAMLAAFSLGVYLWLKSSKKVITAIIAIIVGASIFSFMPQSWHDRMSTIETYEEDRSAMGRINAWTMATTVAASRLTGGGYEIWRAEVFAEYSPKPDYVHDAHSIYFEVLGEQGFIGLLLFLSVWFLAFYNAGWVIKKARGDPSFESLAVLVRMIQVCLIAYAVGGAFLGLAYFDLPYHLLAMIIAARMIVEKELT